MREGSLNLIHIHNCGQQIFQVFANFCEDATVTTESGTELQRSGLTCLQKTYVRYCN